ncbi:MAG: hypothetical protein ACYCXF_00255 [Thermoleophilia bacterium]
MNITTIIPPKMFFAVDVIQDDVLTCLKQQPNVPVSLDEMVARITGASRLQVLTALLAIEGPVDSAADTDGAYVHHCRMNDSGVYIR